MSNTTLADRLGLFVIAVLALLLLVPLFWMGMGMPGGSHMWDGGMWSGSMGGGMPGWLWVVAIVVQLLFLAVLVAGAVVLYRSLTEDSAADDEALDELRLAYARGDLSDEEFEQRRERLEENS